MDNNAKMAAFNQTRYGEAQALLNKKKEAGTVTTTRKYTLADGKVLVRNPKSNRIDFKTLFAGMHDDSNTTAISNFKTVSDNMLASYKKINK